MPASSETSPVVIIGAGPTGLMAALTLAQHGVPVRVIEKAQEYHQSSRGSGLHPRTLEFFRFLGVYEDARNLGAHLVPMQLYKLPGGTEPVASWMMLEDPPITPDRPEGIIAVSQYLTERIFREHLAKFGVQVELGTESVSIEQDGTGVNLSLKHAGSDKVEIVRCAYVIGADGARGWTRKAIGATFEGQTKDTDGQVWADVVVEGISSERWHVWAEAGKFSILMRPKKERGEFALGIVGQNFDPIDLTDPEKFANAFHEYTGRKDVIIKKFNAISYWKPKMRMVNQLSKGRVFLCGDAAHVHSPTGGQGLNTSVGDSFNVAWKLALVYKGLAAPDLLTTYQTERHPVIAQMLTTTSGFYSRLVDQNPYESAKDGETSQETGFVRWRNRALHQLDINYRWSPIVFDYRGEGDLDEETLKARGYTGYLGEPVRAGDRAPEAPGLVDATSKETSLFQVFKANVHTLLLFVPEGAGDKAKEIVDAAQASSLAGTLNFVLLGREGVPAAIEGVTTYHDKEGYAYKGYGVDDEALTVVVVRPDGYIGAFVQDVDGLKTYISRIADGFL